ncbi:MAG: hypothetical protein QGH37_19525, partial [Candidatus Poribacteria bacterium]|nr:hypothetical protein [Candidatus Poribacteria bacterium]
ANAWCCQAEDSEITAISRVGGHQSGRSDGSATGTDPAEPSQLAGKTDSEPQVWAGGQWSG